MRTGRSGPVLTLTLDRPDKLNALDAATVAGLRDAVARAAGDDAVRAVVLTGTGRAFCAGADLAEVAAPTRNAFLDALEALFRELRALRKPLVGAANGLSVAGGLELLLCCDLVAAADGARFGDGHLRHGLLPGGGAATSLPGRIGLARARQLLLADEVLDAATARDWGLVNWVVPPGELASYAAALAERLAAADPSAVAALKDQLDREPPDAFAREAAAMRAHLTLGAAGAALRRFGRG